MGRDESTAPAPSRSGTRQSFLPPAPIPVLGLASPSSQKRSPLSFHTLAWNPFCNPFVFKFIHGMEGVYPPRGLECLSPAPYPLLVPRKTEGSPFFSHSCALFRTFLHSRKTQLFSFQSFPHSLAKTPGGRGEPLCCQRILLRMQPPQHQARKKKWDRHESLSHKS